MPSHPATVTFVTPTFLGDLERFRLLRTSMRALGMAIPHVAIVQTEDLAAFHSALGWDSGVALVPSADVLPAAVERARRRGSGRSPRGLRPLALRALQASPRWRWSVSGWQAQQLTKLAAGAVVDTEHWVCLDSDSVFVRPVTREAFFDGHGQLLLNRLSDPGEQQVGPRRRSAALLGLDAGSLDQSVYYVDVPVPLHRGVVLDLMEHVQRRTGRSWEAALVSSRATEYMTYGLFAEHLDPQGRTTAQRLNLSRLLYRYDKATFPEELARLAEGGVSMVMVHSRLNAPVAELESAIAAYWRQS